MTDAAASLQDNQNQEVYYVEEESESYYDEEDAMQAPQIASNMPPQASKNVEESLLINKNEDEPLVHKQRDLKHINLNGNRP